MNLKCIKETHLIQLVDIQMYFPLYLHMSLQLLQQGRVLVEPHERLTEAGGQAQDPWSAGPLTLHELVELVTVKTHPQTHKRCRFPTM